MICKLLINNYEMNNLSINYTNNTFATLSSDVIDYLLQFCNNESYINLFYVSSSMRNLIETQLQNHIKDDLLMECASKQ